MWETQVSVLSGDGLFLYLALFGKNVLANQEGFLAVISL
jgi:hypothetical protein